MGVSVFTKTLWETHFNFSSVLITKLIFTQFIRSFFDLWCPAHYLLTMTNNSPRASSHIRACGKETFLNASYMCSGITGGGVGSSLFGHLRHELFALWVNPDKNGHKS